MPLGSLTRRPNVLIVLHQEHSTPGRVGLTLKGMDAKLDIRRPSLGEPLPETLADHDGVVVFGGPMGANDTLDWVRREINWLEIPLGEDKPILRLMPRSSNAGPRARRAGVQLRRQAQRDWLLLNPAHGGGQDLCPAQFPQTVYQWHSDGFDLPEGAELLAVGGPNFPNQAYRYGRHAIGLQFHPEVTYHMMCRWTHRGAERLTRPGALSRPEHLAGWFQHDGRVAVWLEEFLPAWLERRLAEPAPKPCPTSPPNRAPEREVSAIHQAAV